MVIGVAANARFASVSYRATSLSSDAERPVQVSSQTTRTSWPLCASANARTSGISREGFRPRSAVSRPRTPAVPPGRPQPGHRRPPGTATRTGSPADCPASTNSRMPERCSSGVRYNQATCRMPPPAAAWSLNAYPQALLARRPFPTAGGPGLIVTTGRPTPCSRACPAATCPPYHGLCNLRAPDDHLPTTKSRYTVEVRWCVNPRAECGGVDGASVSAESRGDAMIITISGDLDIVT